jgi:hypothetical protein
MNEHKIIANPMTSLSGRNFICYFTKSTALNSHIEQASEKPEINQQCAQKTKLTNIPITAKSAQ